MNDTTFEYLLPEPARAADIAALTDGRWRLSDEPSESLARTFYDTFDWAIYRAGGMLERRAGLPLPMLVWRDLAGSREPLYQAAPAEPAFAADLPPGPVRAHLVGIAGIRRLLPVMRLQTHLTAWRLHNGEDKTVVLLRLEESRYCDPATGAEGELGVRLAAIPVRGREDERAAALALLTDRLGLVPVPRPRLLEALAAAGRRPGDYSSKLDYRLDPQMRTDLALRQILLGLLATLEANIPGARANLDSEFLHDLRVATRRTRSALGQLRKVFPSPEVERFKADFAWLQQVTGPVRDLDVYLLDFDTYLASLPAPLRPHLEPVRSFLLSHYAQEQRQLAETLGSERCAGLIAEWRALLEGQVGERAGPANAARPVKPVVDERLRRLVKQVRREGRAIRADSPPADLHELRKSCKKLRYLMEFFQSLYPEDDIRGSIRLLKVLLDNLGSFQDLSVQAAHLRELAGRMREAGQADTDTLLAMGALIGSLLARQGTARNAFDTVFAGFLREEPQRTFARLFEQSPL